ncbi:MAG TPA: hypothetical protein VHY31_27365 [Streptosporangiaceae bacterium]|nr:hypothetical protein [Streptosporangiaceae bacterium]
MFAKPVKVLDAAARQVVVQATVDAAVVPAGTTKVAVDLRDGTACSLPPGCRCRSPRQAA